MIIGILGKKFTGKSTVAKYLVETHGYVEYSFADKIKLACMILFNLSEEQVYDQKLKEVPDPRWFNKTPRQILQFVGTEMFQYKLQEFIPELQTNFHTHSLGMTLKNEYNIVISDVRFQHELDFIHEKGGIVIKLTRKSNNSDTHISESGIDEIKNYDICIDNNGSLDTLLENINKVLQK